MSIEAFFDHNVPLNPNGVLSFAGVTPTQYATLYSYVWTIIQFQCEIASIRLNIAFQSDVEASMMEMDEYRRVPRYVTVMKNALSQGVHIGVDWFGQPLRARPKVVNTGALGSTDDLLDIQKEVHEPSTSPPQSWALWVRLYNDWLDGKNNKYGETVNQRLDIMMDRKIAPFWELMNYGNHFPAYPRNKGAYVLEHFASTTYKKEIQNIFTRSVADVRFMLMSNSFFFAKHTPAVRTVNGKTHAGYTFKSRLGNEVFVIAGTERLNFAGGRALTSIPTGRGLLFSNTGKFIRKWAGRIKF